MGINGDVLQLGVDVNVGANDAKDVDLVTAALAKFRTEAGALAGSAGGANVGAQINVAIGAFQKLGQTIDVTNARAVTGFALMGDQLAENLVKLGATDAEIAKIGASVARVQQQAGAAGLGSFIPASLGPNLTGTAFATRRAGDALASLSLSAQGGKVSMAALSVGLGTITTDVAALAGASLGLATILGAVVTVGLAFVGVLENMGSKSKTAKQNLEDLRTEMQKSASSTALRQQIDETNQALKRAQAARDDLQKAQRQATPASAFGPGGAPPVTANQAAISALDKQIVALQQKQAALIVDLEKRGKDATKNLADAERQSDQETAKLAVQAAQGEFAARRLGVQQDFDNEKKRLDELAIIEGQQTDAVAAARRRRDQSLAAIDVEEAQKLADLKAAADEKAIKTREEAELAGNKSTLDATETALQQALASRAITEAQFIALRLSAQKAAIAADEQTQLESAGKVLFAEQEKLKTATGTEGIQKRADAEKAFADTVAKIRADGAGRVIAVERDADKEIAALATELAKTVESANVAVLESQQRFVEAAQAQVKEEFRGSIQTALAEIVSGNAAGFTALAALQARIQQITGAAQQKEAQARGTDIFADLQSSLRQTAALAESGAISQSDAQDRVIAAYQTTQAQLATLITQYEQLAAAQPDNTDLARTVQDLNTQYIELGITISRLQDPLRALKDAAESATGASLANFLQGATKLFSQSHVEVNALAGELGNARQELDQLLAVPATERTSNQTARITELRGEVETLTVSLNNSKQALTSWKSLFVDALNSILDALIKVSSQAAASGIFGFLSRVFTGNPFGTDPGTGASDFFGVYGHAEGGLISGPGGVDNVPGMLTAGEYVVRQPAVAALGTDFMETINRAGFGGSPLALRRMPGHFAGGGLVTRSSAEGGPSGGKLHVLIEHSADSVVRVIDSPPGHETIVKVVRKNSGAISSTLSRTR